MSVSDKILENFNSPKFHGRTLLVQHGVAESFFRLAEQVSNQHAGSGTQIGYVGNLDRAVINWKTIDLLTIRMPDVGFHFWGPWSSENQQVAALKNHDNVHLHGAVTKDLLAERMADMDGFLLLYNYDRRESDLSNSHKLLEYFSTGKVVFSVPLSEYTDCVPLIKFVRGEPGEQRAEELAGMIAIISDYNVSSVDEKRKKMARQSSYQKNLEAIDRSLLAIQSNRVN